MERLGGRNAGRHEKHPDEKIRPPDRPVGDPNSEIPARGEAESVAANDIVSSDGPPRLTPQAESDQGGKSQNHMSPSRSRRPKKRQSTSLYRDTEEVHGRTNCKDP